MTRQSGARFIAQTFHQYGVTHVFLVPAILLKACAEMESFGITRVVAHGEKSTAYMADGYARASGRPGVCLAQHIGGSNLAAGLRDACLAGSPVFAVTGGPITATRHRRRKRSPACPAARTSRRSHRAGPSPGNLRSESSVVRAG